MKRLARAVWNITDAAIRAVVFIEIVYTTVLAAILFWIPAPVGYYLAWIWMVGALIIPAAMMVARRIA